MSQTFSKHISAYVTPEMYQFLQLMAERHKLSVSDVVRQAIREHLAAQEDVIGSRSRLGRTVIARIEAMHGELLQQQTSASKLLLAAVFILLTEQGIGAEPALKRMLNLASHRSIDRLINSVK